MLTAPAFMEALLVFSLDSVPFMEAVPPSSAGSVMETLPLFPLAAVPFLRGTLSASSLAALICP